MQNQNNVMPANGKGFGRIHVVDFARGIAVAMMIVSNFLFDLYFFCGLPLSPYGWLGWLSRATAGLFLLLVGVSLTLSRQRGGRGAAFGSLLCRSLLLIGLGSLVSLATWSTAGDQLVIFGVLHCIGLSLILSYPLVTRPVAAAIAGGLVLAAAPVIQGMDVDHLWLIWLGARPASFSSVDYIPVVPWTGLVFIGIFCGNVLFPRGRMRLSLSPSLVASRPGKSLSWLGQHSLIIYFVHQPVLLAGLWLWFRITGQG